MKKDKGNRTRISDLEEVTVPSEVPKGIISSEEDVRDLEVDERDVEIIRRWDSENRL